MRTAGAASSPALTAEQTLTEGSDAIPNPNANPANNPAAAAAPAPALDVLTPPEIDIHSKSVLGEGLGLGLL